MTTKPTVEYAGYPFVSQFGSVHLMTTEHTEADPFTTINADTIVNYDEKSGQLETKDTIYKRTEYYEQ